jgi:hypothetical protein
LLPVHRISMAVASGMYLRGRVPSMACRTRKAVQLFVVTTTILPSRTWKPWYVVEPMACNHWLVAMSFKAVRFVKTNRGRPIRQLDAH